VVLWKTNLYHLKQNLHDLCWNNDIKSSTTVFFFNYFYKYFKNYLQGVSKYISFQMQLQHYCTGWFWACFNQSTHHTQKKLFSWNLFFIAFVFLRLVVWYVFTALCYTKQWYAFFFSITLSIQNNTARGVSNNNFNLFNSIASLGHLATLSPIQTHKI